MLKAPDAPSNKEMLDSARVNPSDYAGERKQSSQGIDSDKVRWEQFEREFFGHTFTDEDKKALRETGNLGRTVELTFPGKDEPTLFLLYQHSTLNNQHYNHSTLNI